MASLDVRYAPGGAELRIDGFSHGPVPGLVSGLDGGIHLVELVRDGLALDMELVTLEPGERRLLIFDPPPTVRPLGVIIENHPGARPQAGLVAADVVYEALAEGGITRFLALYLTGNAGVAGPVRSLRHYFAWIAAEYGADLVHVGASPQGYAWREALNLGHLDDTFGEPGFWRSADRAAPHNDYTDTFQDRRFLSQLGRQQTGSWAGLRFRPAGAPLPRGDAATRLQIVYPGGHQVGYDYDASSGRYLRSMAGRAHVDALDGRAIAPVAVLVQYVPTTPIAGDDKDRLEMEIEGSGDFLLFADGLVRRGRWNRPSIPTYTRWLDVDGASIELPRGPIWIQVVPLDAQLTIAVE